MNIEGDSNQPLISIVIPARNEAADIAMTLDACLAIDYLPKEVIVVDDSTDNTPEIVAEYARHGVRLIHREKNKNGCCGARNLGMMHANGEIIVLLNADDRPSPDFLQKILSHYQNGADYVVVKSVVKNLNNIWAKYIWANALLYLSTNPDMEWSEGFSCRKAAADKVGYIPGDFPIPFCRDYSLGESLKKAGYSKHQDLNIPMEHIAPGDLKSFWSNRVWRGTFTAPFAYYFLEKTIPFVFLRELLKLGRLALRYLLIFPIVSKTFRLARFMQVHDLPGLLWANLVHDIALTVGGFKGFILLAKTFR